MSRLAKYKAKGSDKSVAEWEAILERRRITTSSGQNFVELKSKKEVMENWLQTTKMI